MDGEVESPLGGGGSEFAADVERLVRDLVDSVVAADLPGDRLEDVVEDLERLTKTLERYVPEDGPVDPRLPAAPANARVGRIPWRVTSYSDDELRGLARFRLVHAGSSGVVHGGAVAFLMDEVMGVFANRGLGQTARTAVMSVSFKNVTPVGTELFLHVVRRRTEGRKQWIEATVSARNGMELVSAEALFITVLDEYQQ